jgi:hypothetical protein
MPQMANLVGCRLEIVPSGDWLWGRAFGEGIRRGGAKQGFLLATEKGSTYPPALEVIVIARIVDKVDVVKDLGRDCSIGKAGRAATEAADDVLDGVGKAVNAVADL